MKNIKYFFAAACVVLLAACQDKGEWDVPATEPTIYGNNNITEDNIISIKDLLTQYSAVISNDKMEEITTDTKVKGRVTCNDVGGNFYKKITIQDEPTVADDARALTISIDEGGIWGYLAIGQEIIVDLKGLFIGGYGSQAQIGTPYTKDGANTSVGRMSKHLWQQHFKIVGSVKEIEPIDFATAKTNKDKYGAYLVKFTDVTFKEADGKATFKSGAEAALSGYFIQETNEFPGVQFFTSGNYAKFSSMILPYNTETQKAKKCTIVGIASRYRDTWQISIRKTSDITVNE